MCVQMSIILFRQATTAQAEKEELRKRWDALWGQVIVNLGYAPLTLHWCVHLTSVMTLNFAPSMFSFSISRASVRRS